MQTMQNQHLQKMSWYERQSSRFTSLVYVQTPIYGHKVLIVIRLKKDVIADTIYWGCLFDVSL